MAGSPQEIKTLLRKAAGLEVHQNGATAKARLPDSVKDDLKADEQDPSRVAPSAEGVVTFAGLPRDVRRWLASELEKLGRNGNGRPPR